MKAQLRRLGLGHDKRRSFATIDPDYYKWTQWIFLQIFDSWYDEEAQKARPIADLVARFESGERPVPGTTRAWSELTAAERADVLSGFRLAYASDAPVNWCPGLGTVLANEEVTADGRSEQGQLPRVQGEAAPVEHAHHRLRRPAAGRPGRTGLARGHQAAAAELDRPLRGRPPGLRRRRQRRSRSSPPAPTRCSAPPTWSWRPSTSWSTRSSPKPGRRAPSRCGPAGTPPRAGRRRLPQAGRRQVRRRAAGRRPGEDRRLHRCIRHQPGQR